jgi:hypothetical protein
MAIFLTVLLITAVAIGVIVLSQRGRAGSRARSAANRAPADKSDTTGSLTRLREKGHFWGVELGQSGCAASDKLLGSRFTFDEAPVLPLDGCSRNTCSCHFKGLLDRRTQPRRMKSDRRDEVRFDKTHPDRRRNAGRRRGDMWVGHSL